MLPSSSTAGFRSRRLGRGRMETTSSRRSWLCPGRPPARPPVATRGGGLMGERRSQASPRAHPRTLRAKFICRTAAAYVNLERGRYRPFGFRERNHGADCQMYKERKWSPWALRPTTSRVSRAAYGPRPLRARCMLHHNKRPAPRDALGTWGLARPTALRVTPPRSPLAAEPSAQAS